jgi:Tol biopolymer transport system component
MPDDTGFDADLAARLVAYSRRASRPFDAGDVARAAVRSGRRRAGPLGGRSAGHGWGSLGAGLRVAVVLGLLALGVFGAAVVGSRLLITEPPASRAILALGTNDGLVFAAADGSDPVVIDGRGPAFGPRWSPDGTTLVVAAVLPDDANALLFVHADGDEYGRSGQASSYRWSRDSRWVAVIGMEPLDLRVQDAQSGESSELPLPPGATSLAGMDWTPDGRLVVGIVGAAGSEEHSALWLLDPAGGDPVALEGDAAFRSSYPSVSPDGTRVAVLTERCIDANACEPLVRVLDLASGQRRSEVENVTGPGQELAWSPDGSMLAYDSVVGQGRAVFVFDVKGEVRQLTGAGQGVAWLNGWTPDGTGLLVTRQLPDGASSRMESWRVDATTGEGTRLAGNAHGAALQPRVWDTP